jgi:hypothetical protein
MTEISEWPTEAEAAAAIGVSIRTLQRYAEKGQIEIRSRPREGKKPENVCNPRDVDRLLPTAYIMAEQEEPVQAPAPVHRNGHAKADAFFAFISTITSIATVAAGQNGGIVAKPWIRLEEAAEASGLEPAEIATLCREGRISALRHWRHGWRVNRASLMEFRG